MERYAGVRTLGAIDWDSWMPQQRATLCFVERAARLLLIHKKRGIGAGKINGPGGRIDPGESALECAVREVREELCVVPTGLGHCGELSFQFVDGLSIHVSVFTATGCDGEPRETDEARPLWVARDEIPYDRMWADDRIWLPIMLDGHCFRGRALFDGDDMLGHDIERVAAVARPTPGSDS